MSKNKKPVISLSQLEEALEERTRPDRRKQQLGLPENVHMERRKQDRRAGKKSQIEKED